MNKELLYDEGGFCNLCRLEGGDHTDECPGKFIDAAEYEVSYSGPNWGRNGDTEGFDRADTLEDAIRAAGEALADSEVSRFRAEARIVARLEVVTAEVTSAYDTAMKAKRAKEAATMAAQRAQEAEHRRALSIAALEAMRGDLTPWAYQRRLASIQISADWRGEP